MESKLHIDTTGHGLNILDIKLDENSIACLARGTPFSLGFFLDDQNDYPDWKRTILKVRFSTNLDLDKTAREFKNKTIREALVDKSYMFDALRAIQNQMAQAFSKELQALGLTPTILPIQNSTVPDDVEINMPKLIEILPERIDYSKYVTYKEAAQMFGVSYPTISYWVKKGHFNNVEGEIYDIRLLKKELEDLIKNPPAWLLKARKRINKRRTK